MNLLQRFLWFIRNPTAGTSPAVEILRHVDADDRSVRVLARNCLSEPSVRFLARTPIADSRERVTTARNLLSDPALRDLT